MLRHHAKAEIGRLRSELHRHAAVPIIACKNIGQGGGGITFHVMSWNLCWEMQAGRVGHNTNRTSFLKVVMKKERLGTSLQQLATQKCTKQQKEDIMTKCSLNSAMFVRKQIEKHPVRLVCLQEVFTTTFNAWAEIAFPLSFRFLTVQCGVACNAIAYDTSSSVLGVIVVVFCCC